MNENTPMTPAQQLFAEEHHCARTLLILLMELELQF